MGLEEIIEEFDLNKIESSTLQDRMISIRLPDDYKMKYEIIQARSKKKYAEHLRKLIMAAIDKVNLESKAG